MCLWSEPRQPLPLEPPFLLDFIVLQTIQTTKHTRTKPPGTPGQHLGQGLKEHFEDTPIEPTAIRIRSAVGLIRPGGGWTALLAPGSPTLVLLPSKSNPAPPLVSGCPVAEGLLDGGVEAGSDEDKLEASVLLTVLDGFNGPAPSLGVIRGIKAVTVGFACCSS